MNLRCQVDSYNNILLKTLLTKKENYQFICILDADGKNERESIGGNEKERFFFTDVDL